MAQVFYDKISKEETCAKLCLDDFKIFESIEELSYDHSGQLLILLEASEYFEKMSNDLREQVFQKLGGVYIEELYLMKGTRTDRWFKNPRKNPFDYYRHEKPLPTDEDKCDFFMSNWTFFHVSLFNIMSVLESGNNDDYFAFENMEDYGQEDIVKRLEKICERISMPRIESNEMIDERDIVIDFF